MQVQLEGAGEEVGDDVVAAVDARGVSPGHDGPFNSPPRMESLPRGLTPSNRAQGKNLILNKKGVFALWANGTSPRSEARVMKSFAC